MNNDENPFRDLQYMIEFSEEIALSLNDISEIQKIKVFKASEDECFWIFKEPDDHLLLNELIQSESKIIENELLNQIEPQPEVFNDKLSQNTSNISQMKGLSNNENSILKSPEPLFEIEETNIIISPVLMNSTKIQNNVKFESSTLENHFSCSQEQYFLNPYTPNEEIYRPLDHQQLKPASDILPQSEYSDLVFDIQSNTSGKSEIETNNPLNSSTINNPVKSEINVTSQIIDSSERRTQEGNDIDDSIFFDPSFDLISKSMQSNCTFPDIILPDRVTYFQNHLNILSPTITNRLVLCWLQQTPRIKDNLSLNYARYLSQIHQIPVLAVTFVNSESYHLFESFHCNSKDDFNIFHSTQPTINSQSILRKEFARLNQIYDIHEKLCEFNIPFIPLFYEDQLYNQSNSNDPQQFPQLELLRELLDSLQQNGYSVDYHCCDEINNPIAKRLFFEFYSQLQKDVYFFDNNNFVVSKLTNEKPNPFDFTTLFYENLAFTDSSKWNIFQDQDCKFHLTIDHTLNSFLHSRLEIWGKISKYLLSHLLYLVEIPSLLTTISSITEYFQRNNCLDNYIKQYGFSILNESLCRRYFDLLETFSELSWEIFYYSYNSGLLSPVYLSSLYQKFQTTISTKVENIMTLEFAKHNIYSNPSLTYEYRPKQRVWDVEWFQSIPKEVLDMLLVDPINIKFASLQKRFSAIKLRYTPGDIKSATSPSPILNQLNTKLIRDGYDFTYREIKMWILYFLILMPTIEQGINYSFLELSIHSISSFADYLNVPALFSQAMMNITTEIETKDIESLPPSLDETISLLSESVLLY